MINTRIPGRLVHNNNNNNISIDILLVFSIGMKIEYGVRSKLGIDLTF